MMTKRALLAFLLMVMSCGRAEHSPQPVSATTATAKATAAAETPTVHASVTTPTPAASAAVGSPSAAQPGQPARIAIVVMENAEYGTIAGNPSAPYINGLARTYANATSYYAVAHPSLPNYIALLGGDTFGITTNCTSCHVDAPNLAGQLQDKGIAWKAYMEGMPTPCFTGGSFGRYAKKHNPFVYFDDVVSDPVACANVVPLTTIDYENLPDFVWITPDLCNDTHDCPVSTGDRYLSNLVPKLLHGLGPRGVVVITYDEGSTSVNGGGHIFTVLAGPGVRPGRFAQIFTHYSLLRTIENAYGLRFLGRARTASSMAALMR